MAKWYIFVTKIYQNTNSSDLPKKNNNGALILPWVRKTDSPGREQRQKFYASTPWRRLRAEHLELFPKCVRCGVPGRVVDHITPIRFGGGKLDPDNLQTMCDTCHNIKSNAERYKTEDDYKPKGGRGVEM